MAEITGILEDIVFKNEENGYTIAHLKNGNRKHTIIGIIPYVKEGSQYKAIGEWVTHQKFGEQMQVSAIEEILPTSKLGIEKYLSSGIISGVGPVTAKKIVEHFGEKTLEILDTEIDRLKEINGIGKKKIELIIKSYSSQRELRNIMIFFQTYGMTANQCMKIYKRFGGSSVAIVKDNPYILTEEVTGIGFKTADRIAMSLGIEKKSIFRIKSGIKYLINEFCLLGNTYMPLNKLIKKAIDTLEVDEEIIDAAIRESVIDGKIKIENIDNVQCVFTIQYAYSEMGVTKKLVQLCTTTYDELEIDYVEEIKKFEDENSITLAKCQREAVEGAMTSGIEVITGGPGTGKTTIINCIVSIFEKYGMKVNMAAPTGRAAKRMSEATSREAKTIHRLLEMGASEDDEDDDLLNDMKLECDVLIVDEASMIDINLMNSMMKAIFMGTRLILVGDVDQLPSVGPGNVLRDVIESKVVKTVRLNEIFRQGKESMITVNAHLINDGKMPILNSKGSDFYFIEASTNENIVPQIISLINTRLPKFNKSWDNMKDIQILSPMKKGVAGVDNLNKELQLILNPPGKDKKEKELKEMIFRVGDKVMQTKNNYGLKWTKREVELNTDCTGTGIFNGDVGYIQEIDDENNHVIVAFEDEKIVEYEDMYLDELTLAYAVTIHKSQGSEFPVVIMPMFMGPPMLMNRNLLYTGVTRAKQLVVLVGDRKTVSYMKDNDRSFERYSGLKWRIKEIFGV
ncbi:MAG: SF1B family DNA helicase RecD2 [Clostridium sp.]